MSYEAAMPVTVRLSPREERLLNALAKRRRMSRSDIVREALVEYGARDERAPEARATTYEAWLDVVGVVSLGARDPEHTTGEQFARIVKQDSRARRAR
jgi:predicted transcriptional regulator